MRGRPSRRPRRRGVPESALLVIGLALAAHAHSLSDPDPVSSPRQNKGASAVDPVAAGALSGALGVDDSSYHLTPRPDGVTGANSMHDLDIVFTPAGLRLSAAAYELELGLVAAGREGSREVVASVTPRAERNRVVYERGSLVEWFVNGPIGVQHGFTLEAPPPGPRTSPITLDVRVGGSYRATADASAASAAFIAADGARLAYRDLIAVDAEGRRHPSHIAVVDGGVRLVVDDRDATYPIIVDPFIQTQELHGEGGYGTEFGVSVALEGDTMVVGSRIGDTNRFGQCGRGMAYVFERNGPLWQMVARLSSSRPDLCFYDGLGYAVDISGEWIAVGAPFDAHLLPDRDPASTELEDYNSSQGSVYMYKMPAGGWQDATETEWFTRFDGTDTPGNGDWDDGFGAAVRLEGDTLVIGAPAWDEYELQSGAVFVYKNPIDAGWEHVATLAPSAPAFSKMFGASLGFSNGTIVVGNVHFVFGFNSHDFVSTHAYIFEEPVDGWATTNQETAKLRMGSENAYAVAIDGDTIVLGDWRSQQALVYVKPPGGWADELPPNARLIPESLWTTGWYGFTVAVEGDTVIAATPHALAESAWEGGEAFVFKRPADGWGDDPDEPLEVFSTETLSAPGNRGGFGFAIDLDSSIVAIGEPGASHWIDETGQENPDAGSVFAFNNVTDVDPPVTTIQRTPATPLGEAGWDNAIGVTVTADDGPDGSGIHQIRCVVDLFFQGWTFDELPESPCPYVDGEFQVEGEHTLYAASVDKDGNRSAVDSLLLKLDTTDPFTNIVLDPAEPDGPDGTYTGTVTVRLFYGDGLTGSGIRVGTDGVRCALNLSPAPASFDQMPATLCAQGHFNQDTGHQYVQEGSYTIWFAVKDRAGNTSAPRSKSFEIRRRPIASLSLSPATPDGAQGWYRQAVRVTGSGSTSTGDPVESIRCVLDPAVAPTSFDALPASCPYAGAGALVSTDGAHTVYAASRDAANNTSAVASVSFKIDRTPPQLTCEGTGPARFTIGESEGTMTALVSDGGSGPATATASVTLAATDLASVGNRTVTLTALDVAGNEGTAACSYVVGYDLAIASPAPGATFALGTVVSTRFRLSDADGVPIDDATAATIAGGKRTPCFADALFDDVAQRACPTYSTTTKEFSFAVKTPKGRNAEGVHDIAVQVRAPNGGVINLERVVIQLVR